MRSYAKFSPRFWTGETGKSIRQLGADAQALASYLITCEQSNMIGLYYLPIPNITHHVAITTERCVELLDAFEHLGFAHYDYHKEFMWVTTAASWQLLSDEEDALKPRDKRVKGVQRLLRQLKRQGAPFLELFRARYDIQLCLSVQPDEKLPASPSEAPSMPGAGTGSGAGTGKRKVPKENASADPPRQAAPPPQPHMTPPPQVPLPLMPLAFAPAGPSPQCDECADDEDRYRLNHWLQEGVYHGIEHLTEHLARQYPQGAENGQNQRVIEWVRRYIDQHIPREGAAYV